MCTHTEGLALSPGSLPGNELKATKGLGMRLGIKQINHVCTISLWISACVLVPVDYLILPAVVAVEYALGSTEICQKCCKCS